MVIHLRGATRLCNGSTEAAGGGAARRCRDGFGAASVFETFGNHCIALGMPLEMLMVEERSRDGSGATIWIRLPASERAVYREFGEALESGLPKRAILLIGHKGEFEKLFDYAEDDDQLVQPRRD